MDDKAEMTDADVNRLLFSHREALWGLMVLMQVRGVLERRHVRLLIDMLATRLPVSEGYRRSLQARAMNYTKPRKRKSETPSRIAR